MKTYRTNYLVLKMKTPKKLNLLNVQYFR